MSINNERGKEKHEMKNKIINVCKSECRNDVRLAAGECVVVIATEYVGPTNCHRKNGAKSFWIVPLDACMPNGPATNGGGHRWDGWLGTTDDVYRESLGAFEIVSASESRQIDHAESWPGCLTVRKTRLELRNVTGEVAA